MVIFANNTFQNHWKSNMLCWCCKIGYILFLRHKWLKSAKLTFGHPVQCACPRYHGSATHSPAPWSSSGANQETGWYLRTLSAPRHTELTEHRAETKVRAGRQWGKQWSTCIKESEKPLPEMNTKNRFSLRATLLGQRSWEPFWQLILFGGDLELLSQLSMNLRITGWHGERRVMTCHTDSIPTLCAHSSPMFHVCAVDCSPEPNLEAYRHLHRLAQNGTCEVM